MKIIITEKDKEILKNYNIDINEYDNLRDLLIEIDDEMTTHVDEHDEPLEEFLELEKVYDRIFYANSKEEK